MATRTLARACAPPAASRVSAARRTLHADAPLQANGVRARPRRQPTAIAMRRRRAKRALATVPLLARRLEHAPAAAHPPGARAPAGWHADVADPGADSRTCQAHGRMEQTLQKIEIARAGGPSGAHPPDPGVEQCAPRVGVGARALTPLTDCGVQRGRRKIGHGRTHRSRVAPTARPRGRVWEGGGVLDTGQRGQVRSGRAAGLGGWPSPGTRARAQAAIART